MAEVTVEVVKGLLETPTAFRAWLHEAQDHWIVGFPNKRLSCPFARFLESANVPQPQVGHASVAWRNYGHRTAQASLPEWASDFVLLVDTENHRVPVTAARALYLLDQVTQ